MRGSSPASKYLYPEKAAALWAECSMMPGSIRQPSRQKTLSSETASPVSALSLPALNKVSTMIIGGLCGRRRRIDFPLDKMFPSIGPYSCKFLITRDEFVPPNPNELERKVSKCLCTSRPGIRSLAESSSGFSKFRLAAMKSFFIIRIE